MAYNWKLLIFTLLVGVHLKLNLAVIVTENVQLRYYFYRNDLENGKIKETMQDLSSEKKLRICNLIMQDEQLYKKFDILINKTGSQRTEDAFEWESNRVDLLNLTNVSYDVRMFPCYGRHEPMRTSWLEDDNYKKVYVTAGPEEGSLFVIIRTLYASVDSYDLYGSMTNIIADTLAPVYFNEAELEEEENSLNELSYNSDKAEIEILYIRNVLIKELEKSDEICNLEVNEKKRLCSTVLSENLNPDIFYSVDDDAFAAQNPECVTKKVYFFYEYKFNNSYDNRQDMYPCYGQSDRIDNGVQNPMFFLASGFRRNSILVYVHFENDKVMTFGFVENVKISN